MDALLTKTCRRCCALKAHSDFTRHPTSSDGLQSYCKGCSREYLALWRRRAEPEPEPEPDDLYVMRLLCDGGERFGVKVGRSKAPACRARQLASALPFKLEVLATFPGRGHRETAVHRHLSHFRSEAAREWFIMEPWALVARVSLFLADPPAAP